MPKVKNSHYACRKGRKVGIYSTWEECQAQTSGFKGAEYAGFKTLEEAQAYMQGASGSGSAKSPYQRLPALGEANLNVKKNGANKQNAKESSNSKAKPDNYDINAKGKVKTNEVQKDKEGRTIVFTDGACSNNGKGAHLAKAGVGVWWGSGNERNVSERCPGDQTNNRAELIAIIRALETDLNPSEPLAIHTDSKYSISCIGLWLPQWRNNNFRSSTGKEIKNLSVILYLAALLDDRPGPAVLHYVPGHSGIIGNEQADRLAVAGANKSVLPERDWTMKMTSRLDMPKDVEFDVPEDFLLSEEELLAMERDQVFD